MSASSLCLVVDDSRVIRHLASDLLKGFGFTGSSMHPNDAALWG